jgi:hypothetical protein
LLDTSGKARHLTTFTNLAFAAGPSGLDLSFVDRSVIRAASVPTINGSSWTQFSLAWECSAADAAAANRIFSFLFASTNGFEIYRSVGTYDMLIRFARSGGSEVVTVPNIFDATVREYALTFDLASKAWIVYRDGAAFLNNTLGNTPIMPNRVFVIGNYDTPSSANGHVGLIGKVRLWGNRVLTPAEALSLAQNPRQI